MNPREGGDRPKPTFADVSIFSIREIIALSDGKTRLSPKALIAQGFPEDRVLFLAIRESKGQAGTGVDGISDLHFLEAICEDFGLNVVTGEVDLETKIRHLKERIAWHLNKTTLGFSDVSTPQGGSSGRVFGEEEGSRVQEEVSLGEFADFSFFKKEAQRSLENISAFELLMLVKSQPEMSGRFFHEFWKTNRQKDIYEAVKLISREEMPNFFVQMMGDLSESTARICSERSVSLDAAAGFVNDIAIIVVKARLNKPFETELPWAAEQLAYDISLYIMRNVKQLMG